jgi:2-polyprenyl-6-methoxyphenol hydroxylase-like FAD-dependent oxidoreductase
MSSMPSRADVVIVGAGPVGLAMGVELGLRGRQVVIVEKDPQRGPQPRAKTLNMRSLQHLRRWGLADEVRRNSPRPEDLPTDVVFSTRLYGHHIATIPNIYFRGNLRQDDPRFSEPSEWVPQFVVEQVMRRKLQTLSNVTICDGTELRSFSQDGDGVEVVVTAGADEATIKAAFLVGADGARSTVREGIGAKLVGRHAFSSHYNMVLSIPEFTANPPEQRGIMHWIINPDNPSVMSPMGDVWYLGKQLPEGRTDLTPEEIRDFIFRTTGREVAYEVLSADRWYAHELVADKYRDRRIFLVGDACHLHPPFGGYGMNMGIADAVDLGWKLDAVLTGWGGEGLLQAYEWERKRVHEWTIAEAVENYRVLTKDLVRPGLEDDDAAGAEIRSKLADEIIEAKRREFHTIGVVLGYHYSGSPIVGEGIELPSPSAEEYVPVAQPGALAPHVWLEKGVSLYDRFGRNYTLLDTGGDPASVAALKEAAAEASFPLTHLQLHDTSVSEIYGAGLFLIRPDEHIAWTGVVNSLAQAKDVLRVITGSVRQEATAFAH